MAKKKLAFNRRTPGRWERSEPDVFSDAPSDDIGKVRIYIRAIDPANNVVMKGTISRSFTIGEARVSDVAEAVEQALFGGKEKT